MKTKFLVVLFLAFLIVGALAPTVFGASNFIIRNESNSAQTYLIVNGTTGNVEIQNWGITYGG